MDIKSLNSESLPRMLKEIPGPPEKLFVMGELPDDNIPLIAIVGTRKATTYGLNIAVKLAEELSRAGIVVVSGLAMGIDTAAHTGALKGGSPTLAVLGNSLPKIYPAQNENLARKIIDQGGAIISEYETDTPSYKDHFIQRNRIISGLSLAIVVIEAPARSGALATAGFAARQGREVFVIPGPINHPNYAGSHSLIRDGARLVTSTKDILLDLGLTEVPQNKTATEEKLLEGLAHDERAVFIEIRDSGAPLSVDKIAELIKLDPQKVNQILASLTIRGFIQEAGGGYTI